MLTKEIIELALLEDIGCGDVTTESIVPKDLKIQAQLVAKENLVLAGMEVVEHVFAHFDPELIDQFNNIARDLYDEFSGRDDERLKDQLRDMTNRYFQSGIDTLSY